LPRLDPTSRPAGDVAGSHDELPDEVANDCEVDATVVAGKPAGSDTVPVNAPFVPATVQVA
jgi:hypothetical protein